MSYAVWGPGVLFGICCILAMFLMFLLPETAGRILSQTIEEMEIWTKEQSFFKPYRKIKEISSKEIKADEKA